MARNLLFSSCTEFEWIAATRMEDDEVIALLFPEPTRAKDGPIPLAIALLRDAQGSIELRQLRPDKALIKRALVTGRMNGGKPIRDPVTREIIGYEIEPITLAAA